MKNRTYINNLKEKVGGEISICGWVDVRRDQGKMVFVDMRDMTGKVQCVVLPNHTEALIVAQKIRPEWVIEMTGIVNKRPERNVKQGEMNGDIEIEVTGIVILNEAETPFFDPKTDGLEIARSID